MPSWMIEVDEEDFIVGASQVRTIQSAPVNANPGRTYHLVPEVVYLAVGDAIKHKPKPGPLRWKWIGGAAVEQADNRPIVRFSHADAVDVDGVLLVQKQTGDPVTQLVVEVVNDLGEVRTNVTTSRNIEIDGRTVTVSVVNGVGSLNVPTNHPRNVLLSNREQFKVVQPIRIVVTQAQAYNATDL